jgi:hypothetical protein
MVVNVTLNGLDQAERLEMVEEEEVRPIVLGPGGQA